MKEKLIRYNYVEFKLSKIDLCYFFFIGFLIFKDDDFLEINNFNIEYVYFVFRVRINLR